MRVEWPKEFRHAKTMLDGNINYRNSTGEVIFIRLIVNADDFGYCREVNSAVYEAWRNGPLTSASLMIEMEGASEAVRISRSEPGLAVGLHVTLSLGDPVTAALRFYFNRKARACIRRRIWEQFERFAETGLEMSHVDGHQHMHAHPVFLPTIIDLALQYGAAGIRIPQEPYWRSLRCDARRFPVKLGVALGHAYLSSVCRRRLNGAPLAVCDMSIGGMMSGMMDLRYCCSILSGLDCGSAEMFFHPAERGFRVHKYGPNGGDLEVLLNPDFSDYIRRNGLVLSTYRDLARQASDCDENS